MCKAREQMDVFFYLVFGWWLAADVSDGLKSHCDEEKDSQGTVVYLFIWERVRRNPCLK